MNPITEGLESEFAGVLNDLVDGVIAVSHSYARLDFLEGVERYVIPLVSDVMVAIIPELAVAIDRKIASAIAEAEQRIMGTLTTTEGV